MAILNLGSSIRYTNCGRKRKTPAFRKDKKPTLTALREQQAILYRQLEAEHKSMPYSGSGNTAKVENPSYTGERKLLGIGTLHKSNLVPVFAEDENYAKDLAKMRRS